MYGISPQSISLPEKYLAHAREQHRYLTFCLFDLTAQNGLRLSEFYERLAALHKSRELLSLGLFKHRSLQFAPPAALYYLVLSTKEASEKILDRLGLKLLFSRCFYAPDQETINQSNDAKSKSTMVQSANTKESETALKVNLSLLNSLIDTTGEIVLARNALLNQLERYGDAELVGIGKRLNYLISGLQEKVMKARLQKLEFLFQRLPRAVREAANLTGKQVELFFEGGELEIDKLILDQLADPLLHIVRNAVDHGIESPEERRALGKNSTGQIHLSARMHEGNIVLLITDDGRGLDLEKIRATALRKGLITAEQAAQASAEQITEYLFLPGFSTRTEVSTLSGRGVGLDVVRTNVGKLGGLVEIRGEKNAGSTITISLPQSLAIQTCLMVKIDSHRFAIPRQNIAEVVALHDGKLQNIRGNMVYPLRERLLPLLIPEQVFGLSESAPCKFIVVLHTEKHHYGLPVEVILETEEVVVKPIPGFGAEIRLFSGAAIMGDGRLAPIIDAALLARHAGLSQNATALLDAPAATAQKQLTERAKITYLLFRWHGRQLGIPTDGNPRIEKIKPQDLQKLAQGQAVNYHGTIVPILPTDFLTTAEHPETPEYLILLQSGGALRGLFASEIIDLAGAELQLQHETAEHPAISGYTLFNNQTTAILNVAALAVPTRSNNGH